MSVGQVVALMNGGIIEILLLCAPVLIVGTVVGLVISILQATTQIQDQTISFVPKIVAIMAALIIFGPWMFNVLRTYTIGIFNQLPNMVK
jgi:flagellar biosynthetic protein FliQ